MGGEVLKSLFDKNKRTFLLIGQKQRAVATS